MLKKIELATLNHLKANWNGVSEFDISKSFSNIIKFPSVAVTIESIGFTQEVSGLSTNGYLFEPTVSVYVVFKSPQPNFRREGVYPMVELAAALLVGRTFGLEIEPLEPAGRITEVFSQEFLEGGYVVFRIDVKTAFELEIKEDIKEITKLLETYNTYHYREWESDTQKISIPNDLTEEYKNEDTESNS